MSIKIELNSDEALVLSDYIWKLQEDKIDINIKDKALQPIFWSIACQFEKVLLEPFQENYDELVKDAKKRLELIYDGSE